MAFQKPKSPTPTSSRQKEEVEEDEPSPGKVQMEEDLDIQLPRVAKNTDPGIQSESEDEEHEPSNGELEFVSSNREGEEEGEGEVYDASKLILPSVGESSTDDTLLGNVELEEDEEEDTNRPIQIMKHQAKKLFFPIYWIATTSESVVLWCHMHVTRSI